MGIIEVEQPDLRFEQTMQLLQEKNPSIEFHTTWYLNESETPRYLNIEPWGWGPELEPQIKYALLLGLNPDSLLEDNSLEWEVVDANNLVSVWINIITDQQRVLREDGLIVWSNENDEEVMADLETLKRIL